MPLGRTQSHGGVVYQHQVYGGINPCPLCGSRPKRSIEQNKRYWSLLNQISEQVKTADGVFSAEVWHRYFAQRYIGCDDVTLPNRKRIVVPKSTTDLDTAEFTTYMDQVEHWAHEHGVIFNYDE